MHESFQRALFIFRRDLRLEDNSGLIFALKHAKEVLPCFIFTPEQIEHNPYRGNHSLQFLIESLEDLDRQLGAKGARLHLFYGEVEAAIKGCFSTLPIDAVIVNRDYTPYSIQRDQKIEALCKREKVVFKSLDDLLLHPPEETLNKAEKPYTVFTPFYRNSLKLEAREPQKNEWQNYYKGPSSALQASELYAKILPQRALPPLGGRSRGLEILKNLKPFVPYESLRDFPAKEATTHLSAHLKFTTCSPREARKAIIEQLGPSSELLRSIYWREFFACIAFYFPYVFEGPFHKKYNEMQWSEDKAVFERWCQGETGFPIVDAGMRQLKQTGFMHNRVRMITASFLVKDLHINWQWGEKYFAQQLSDYDPAINNGNWQWVAGTGCDAQPYFRVFNPWAQALKFDPECLYIKKWVPELSSASPNTIHKWFKETVKHPFYPMPMVDHTQEAKKAINHFRSFKSNASPKKIIARRSS